MRMAMLAAAILILAAAAGCLRPDDRNGDDPDPPAITHPAPDWAQAAVARESDHNHADPSHHEGRTTPNFHIVGWDPLITDHHGATSGGYFCGEVATQGDRVLAVSHGFTNDMGLVVVDVTDPAEPQLLGELALPRTHVYDAAITDGGQYAVLATNPPQSPDDDPIQLPVLAPGHPANGALAPHTHEPDLTTSLQAVWTDACGNRYESPLQEIPYASGIVLVDIRDPTQPTIADYAPQPVLGAHSIHARTIDGTHYVLASTTNLAHTASYFTFFTIEELPVLGPRLAPYGVVESQYAQGPAPTTPAQTALLNGHVDGTIQKHPITGEVLAHLANWDGGYIVARLEAPGLIVPIGDWNDHDTSRGSSMTGAIHTTLPLEETWGDRHITVIGQEVGGRPAERPTGQIILMDTTDPTDPAPLARWTLPVDVQWDAFLQFSTHYVAIVDDVLFISLYHGGVWAADAREEAWPELPSLGVFMPTNVSPQPPTTGTGGLFGHTPVILDVLALPDGSLVSFDGTSGVYTYRFDRDDPRVEPTEPWTEDAWIAVD